VQTTRVIDVQNIDTMSLSFTDKVVLVTGSGSGLGKEIASRYLESGAKVVLCDINEERLKETEDELSPQGIVLAHKVDITDEDSVKELTEAAVAKFGRLDIVVNNAGVTDKFGRWFHCLLACLLSQSVFGNDFRTCTDIHADPVGSVDKKLWDNVMAVNVTGTFLISKYAVNQMLAQKPVGGAIVNIISVAGFRGFVAGMFQRGRARIHGVAENHRRCVHGQQARGNRCDQEHSIVLRSQGNPMQRRPSRCHAD
jgi:hypothetical protein